MNGLEIYSFNMVATLSGLFQTGKGSLGVSSWLSHASCTIKGHSQIILGCLIF